MMAKRAVTTPEARAVVVSVGEERVAKSDVATAGTKVARAGIAVAMAGETKAVLDGGARQAVARIGEVRAQARAA